MSHGVERLLFDAASGLADADERRAFLDHVCRGDPGLRDLLGDMLELREEAEDFFTFPPATALPAAGGAAARGGEEDLGAWIGRYRLIERIGEGGCGVVYLAEQQEPVWRKVALKIIRLGMDTESVIARFEVERQALALMDHPYIARVLDAGATAGGRPYFVMELADGEKITAFCDRKRLDLRQRLDLFERVCEAIQHAHQKGVIHRDIKPSNVLVREQDGRALPKVIDFGIAKVTAGLPDGDGTATRQGQFIGTPAYMSPEQAEGGPDIDTRSDIYSLGALLCELLVGSPPLSPEALRDRGVGEIRDLLRDGRMARPSARLREIPADALAEIARRRGSDPQRLLHSLAGDLDWIVMKALAPERQRRYETAYGLAKDVRRHLDDEPVLARPPGRRYLLGKLVRRNRVVFAAAGVALAGLLGGLGVSTWLFLRERSARHEQARLREVAELAMANEVRLREGAKAVDLVAQAAVLLRYDDFEQADALLAGLPAGRVPLSLEAADVLMRVANWNLVQGRRRVAAERFHALGHVLVRVDQSDWEGISFSLLSVATAVCEWGEPGQFDELRALMVGRFAGSANPDVAEHILKAALLVPADERSLRGLEPLAAVIERSLAEPSDVRAHLLAWRRFSLALMAYRQGHLEDAAAQATESLAMATGSAHRAVSNRLILAMVDLRQGRRAQALAALRDLAPEVRRWIEGEVSITNPDGTLWYNQWALAILLREAEALADE